MWYRLVGSAVEHAAAVYKEVNPQDDKAVAVDFGELFLKQKTSEEEGVSLGEMLDELDTVMRSRFSQASALWRAGITAPTMAAGLYDGEFTAKELAACLNDIPTIGNYPWVSVPKNTDERQAVAPRGRNGACGLCGQMASGWFRKTSSTDSCCS